MSLAAERRELVTPARAGDGTEWSQLVLGRGTEWKRADRLLLASNPEMRSFWALDFKKRCVPSANKESEW